MLWSDWLFAEITGKLDDHAFMDFQIGPFLPDFHGQSRVVCNDAISSLAYHGRHAKRVIDCPDQHLPSLFMA